MGTQLNLERALKIGDELGGHIVAGHVDGIASSSRVTICRTWRGLTLARPRDLARFIATKGSVTLDGVSLTVNTVADGDVFGSDHPAHAWRDHAWRLAGGQRGQSRSRPDGALCGAAEGDEVTGRLALGLPRCVARSTMHRSRQTVDPHLWTTRWPTRGAHRCKDQTDITGARALIVEARFYDDIQDAMLDGAIAELKAAGVTHDLLTVPGALEIPSAIAIALDAAEKQRQALRSGDRARLRDPRRHLSFRDRVVESSRGLMDLSVARRLPLGNGIITVNTDEQAWARRATAN